MCTNSDPQLPTPVESRARCARRFAHMLIPCALIAVLAWGLGFNGPHPILAPIVAFSAAVLLSAWNCVEAYRKERRDAESHAHRPDHTPVQASPAGRSTQHR